jgi:hypothetical protein
MRGRWFLAKWGIVLGSAPAFAQAPALPQPPAFPQPPLIPQSPAVPQSPAYPGPLAPAAPQSPVYPGANAPGSPQMPPPLGIYPPGTFTPYPVAPASPATQPPEVLLPQKEDKFALNAADVSLKRVYGGWQLWAGQRVLRDFGEREADARDVARVFRDLRPTEWVTIGGPKPVVEYGLVNGRPPMTAPVPGAGPDEARSVAQAGGMNSGPAVTGAGARAVVPIDLKSVRVEAVRGVWCLRDDQNILFNFGTNRADAEQAHAAVLRYGFNRVGVVGSPVVMSYLFASPETATAKPDPFAKLALQSQIDGLARVGIPVAGVGYVGEMIRFDPRKLDVRKEGADWVVAFGTEVIGRYGPAEWVARDAIRAIQDSRYNEFCKVGSTGLTFFLVDGKTPTRVPYNAQGRRFDPTALKVTKTGDKWAVTENGRHLLDCASAEEGETLIRVLKHYQFDQLCHLGPSSKVGVTFLAKGK